MPGITIGYGEIVYRLSLAWGLSGAIGVQRELQGYQAGLRTHILVALGSALIMLTSEYAFADFVGQPGYSYDPTRIAAQVVSGIGFLGAGTIIKEGATVRGLTTAASLWVSSGIGLACGSNYWFGAIVTTGFTLVCLEVLKRVESLAFRRPHVHCVRLSHISTKTMGTIISKFADVGGHVKRVIIDDVTDHNKINITLHVHFAYKTNRRLLQTVVSTAGVTNLTIDGHEFVGTKRSSPSRQEDEEDSEEDSPSEGDLSSNAAPSNEEQTEHSLAESLESNRR